MINFRINENLIKQVKKVVKVHGECHLCGCGNFYTDKKAAQIKRDFTNEDQQEATFMVSFYKVEDVPNTPREMEDAFYNSRRQETKQLAEKEIASNRNIIDMSDDDEKEEVLSKGENTRKNKLIELGCEWVEETNSFVKDEFTMTFDELEALSNNKYSKLIKELA